MARPKKKTVIQASKPREISRGPQKKEILTKDQVEKLMDGAVFTISGKLPRDYVTDKKTGLRPGESNPPKGAVMVMLELKGSEINKGMTIPTRKIWAAGKWKAASTIGADGERDFRTWVVSGEGSPGNWVERHYVVTRAEAAQQIPTHPSKYDEKDTTFGFSYGYTPSWKSAQNEPVKAKVVSASAGLPTGTRALCVGCGHYFKVDDLSDHVQVTCPGSQGDVVFFVMACACCETLQESAKVLPGFPKTFKKPEETKKEEPKKAPVLAAADKEKKEVKA